MWEGEGRMQKGERRHEKIRIGWRNGVGIHDGVLS